MIERENMALIVIDVQDKLLPRIPVAKKTIPRIVKLMRVARELNVPILMTEQYPEGLGGTTADIREAADDLDAIPKMTFGCMGDDGFCAALKATGKKQLLVTGMETHVCVMQTVLGALDQGYAVFVPRDAVAATSKYEHKAGLARMAQAGAELLTTEMAIFETLRIAGTDEFKKILPLLKE